MKLLSTSTLLALLISATGTTAAAQSFDFDKSVGNRKAGADIEFHASYNDGNHAYLNDCYGAGARFKTVGFLWKKKIKVLDVGAEALTHQGGTLSGETIPAETYAHAWLHIAGIAVYDRLLDTSVSWSETQSVPVAGNKGSYGIGPFEIKVDAGLYVWITPSLEAGVTPSFTSPEAEASAGLAVGVTASVGGKLSAGPVGGIKVTASVELVSISTTLVAGVTSQGLDLSMDIYAQAIRILVKLKAWTFFDSWKKTLVDETYKSWSRHF
jgi:hypothetical protein